MMAERPSTPPANLPTHIPHPEDEEALEELLRYIDRAFLQNKTANEEVMAENVQYNRIYWAVEGDYGENKSFVSYGDFMKNLGSQKHHFFMVLKRGVAIGASLADKEAVGSHSMYFYRSVAISS